jgi:RNA polymerase sigma factor (sigma-70 family)
MIRLPVHVNERRRLPPEEERHPGVPAESDATATASGSAERMTVDPLPLQQPLSMDAINGEADGWELIADDGACPDTAVSLSALRTALWALLAQLPLRERVVLVRRYGLMGDRPWTLQEIGQHLGLTRERIRQIEAAALDRLQVLGAAVSLHEYLEA